VYSEGAELERVRVGFAICHLLPVDHPADGRTRCPEPGLARYDAANAVNPSTEPPSASRPAWAFRYVVFAVGLLVVVASPATFARVADVADVARVIEDSSALEVRAAQVQSLGAERADAVNSGEMDRSRLAADAPSNPSADCPGQRLLVRAWPPLRAPPFVETR
jgi:hypothetical protein